MKQENADVVNVFTGTDVVRNVFTGTNAVCGFMFFLPACQRDCLGVDNSPVRGLRCLDVVSVISARGDDKSHGSSLCIQIS